MITLSTMPHIHEGVLHSNCNFGIFTEIGENNVLENTDIGDYSYTGPLCILQNARIGKFVNIAALVRIGPTAHPMDRPSQHHFTYRRKMYGFGDSDDTAFFQNRAEQRTSIGHDSWLGHGAIVMPGVTVGNGAVIGAGSIVTKDIPDYAVAVGNPAKVIKYRFSNDQITALNEICWWDWSHEQIKYRFDDFTQSSSIDQFIQKYRSTK